jgi:hypothetical protein
MKKKTVGGNQKFRHRTIRRSFAKAQPPMCSGGNYRFRIPVIQEPPGSHQGKYEEEKRKEVKEGRIRCLL